MSDFSNSYRAYLDAGKTERECVANSIRIAEEAGFKPLSGIASAKPGDKAWISHRGKTLALFVYGRNGFKGGVNYVTAHVDSPRLDLKMRPVYEKDGLVYLNTHYYGGIKKYQWVACPLALHGVVVLKDGKTINVTIGEDEDDTALTITDILPHIAQEQMKKSAGEFIPGESLDLLCGMNPGEEKDGGKNAVLTILKERFGFEEEDFRSAELEVVPAGRSRALGLDSSMVLGYGQDDRVCAFAALEAITKLDSAPEKTCCVLLVDKEEIGSTGATGMDSSLVELFTAEAMDKAGEYSPLALSRCLRDSSMLSADVAAAYDPLNADLYDTTNNSPLGKGVVFGKYTGSRGKAASNDADAEFIASLRGLLDKAGARYQMSEVMGKVDIGGGGTIAKFAAWYGMNVIDCGVPVLSMHAPWEVAAIKDIESARDVYAAFIKG